MSDAAIVARRRHSVVTHEALVTLGQVVLCCLVQIAVRRRQAIAAMFARHAAKRPERILQTFGQATKLSPPRTTQVSACRSR